MGQKPSHNMSLDSPRKPGAKRTKEQNEKVLSLKTE